MLNERNIAVFLPTWVGDAVMATPALRALRRAAPQARITYIGTPVAVQTLDSLAFFDDRIVDARPGGGGKAGFFSLARAIRRGRFDLMVLLTNSFRSAAAASLAGVPRLAGYARDGRGWLLTDRLVPARLGDGRFAPTPAGEYYAALTTSIGAPCESAQPALAVAPADAETAEAMLAAAHVGSRPLVILNPGASFGVSKMWAPRQFAAVADELISRHGVRVIINVSPGERHIGRAVADAMRRPVAVNMADHNGTIGLLKALTCQCVLMITNDTGARHVAAAFGIGVVTLFGSTDPRWSEIHYAKERTVRVELPCSPCQQPVCPQPAGPLYHKCMEDITPEMVLREAEELLPLCIPAAGEAAT
ncbi:MAG: lipopolysaccharide heptosyltransferase II [Planctomycetota bacterium]|nr:lipopolysaccharide heptosyltransferase II [Planctomycetota bacterium]